MQPIAFWKTWPTFYQRLFWIVGASCICAILFLWIADLNSPSPVFRPDHIRELEAQEIRTHQFQIGTTPVTIPGEIYIVIEHVLGGALAPNLNASYIFLGLLVAGMIVILGVLTTLTRFWFYMGMGLFILFIVSFRLDALALFGMPNKIPVLAVLLAYGAASYYFQFLRPSASFSRRLGLFLIITLLTGATIAKGSHVNQPFYFLSVNGLIPATILSVLFIFTVAHEIIAFFIDVVTRGKKPTKSLRHFLIVWCVYMLNLGLIYAHKKHVVEWEFLPINLFLLVTLSGILGLWGFRQREPLYQSFMRADPFGTYFFLALAAIGFGTMGYFLASANDPLIQFIQDAILYSHVGYGLIFFIYIIANFISLLGSNLQVHKVLYKPQTMPYFTFRFAGLIATFAFFAYSNWKVSINQVSAGYYNAQGDYYLSMDSLSPAEVNYQRSVFFATRNYHAHYALAEFYASRWDFEKEKYELQKLADSRPLDLAYLNYSRIHELSNSWPNAVRVLKAGLIDFPKNGFLQNALGLAYAKLGKEDSAFLMINAARNSSLSRKEAETNLLGLSTRFHVGFPADSLMTLVNPDNPGVKSNAMALSLVQGNSPSFEMDQDSLLTPYAAAAINNYLLGNSAEADTAMIPRIVKLARKPANSSFRNIMLAAAAHASYARGETTTAFKLMHEIAFLGQQPRYYNLLGLWAIEQGAPENAIHYFDEAAIKNFKGSHINRTLALTETADLSGAIRTWDSLGRSGDSQVQAEAKKMIGMLTMSSAEITAAGDEAKYDYSRHRFAVSQENEFATLINSITDQDIRARAIVDRGKKLEEADETAMALNVLGLAKGLKLTDKSIYEAILHLNLRCLAKQEQWDLLSQKLNSPISFDGIYRLEKLYFEALLDQQAGKKEAAAKTFNWLASVNPFFEDAVVAAASFSAANDDDKIKPYNILVNALDLNPNSIKLLKAYFIQAAHLDFDEPAKETLDKLHHLLTPAAFVQFVKENPDIFEITVN